MNRTPPRAVRSGLRRGFAAIGLGLLVLASARAGPPPGVAERREDAPPRWAAGAAVVTMQSPYRGQRGRVWGFPALSYRGPRFFILGPGGGVRLTQAGPVRVDAVARVRFSPFNEKDGGQLAGLKSRSTTVEAGARVSTFLPYGFRVETALTADLLGRHSGAEAVVGVSRPIRRGAWVVTPSVRIEYWSQGLADHYFGVREEERAPDRPAYSPGATWMPTADLMIFRRFGNAWGTMMGVGVTRLGSDIVRSPIVESRTMARGIASVTYAF